MSHKIISEEGFEYVETGDQKGTLLLLHGLFGELSNFDRIIEHFRNEYNVIIPLLPILTLPRDKAGLDGLVDYVEKFVEFKGLEDVHVLGNSLGGHIAQIYALNNISKVSSLILTGSSGLFENPMGSTWPKREDYQFVKRKTEETFYDPSIASKEMIDLVYETVNDRAKVLNIVLTAKSAIRHNLEDKLHQLTMPSLLIWGQNDTITPPFVAEKFYELLPDSRLVFINECGHAPMMEKPTEFNEALEVFLTDVASRSLV